MTTPAKSPDEFDALRTINSRGINAIEWVPGNKAAMILSDVGSAAIVGAIVLTSR